MISAKRKAVPVLSLVMLLALAAGPAFAKQPQSAGETKTHKTAPRHPRPKEGFGEPEEMSGTVSMVLPEQGLIVLTVQDPAHLVDTIGLSHWVDNQNNKNPAGETRVVVRPMPMVTDYNFKVNDSTSIKINGQLVPLANLPNLKDKQAKVRFVPYRTGNVAQQIEVRQ